MTPKNIELEEGWKKILKDEFEKEYFKNLKTFLVQEINSKKTIYPPPSLIFNAFNRCPFNDLKVVILGQDPYHGEKQAHGLSFSVNKGIAIPPSLKNIYKEIEKDLGINPPNHGNLEPWAKQGVLLLNSTLSVQANTPTSHSGKGWEEFTDTVIKKTSENKPFIIFCLWGKFAQSKKELIDTKKHIVLEAAHPSPFSAHNGFFGCKHFSQTNKLLEQKKIPPIDWKLKN